MTRAPRRGPVEAWSDALDGRGGRRGPPPRSPSASANKKTVARGIYLLGRDAARARPSARGAKQACARTSERAPIDVVLDFRVRRAICVVGPGAKGPPRRGRRGQVIGARPRFLRAGSRAARRERNIKKTVRASRARWPRATPRATRQARCAAAAARRSAVGAGRVRARGRVRVCRPRGPDIIAAARTSRHRVGAEDVRGKPAIPKTDPTKPNFVVPKKRTDRARPRGACGGMAAASRPRAPRRRPPRASRDGRGRASPTRPRRSARGCTTGVLLCELANRLQPGSVRKINRSRLPFKQMENISAFVRCARASDSPFPNTRSSRPSTCSRRRICAQVALLLAVRDLGGRRRGRARCSKNCAAAACRAVGGTTAARRARRPPSGSKPRAAHARARARRRQGVRAARPRCARKTVVVRAALRPSAATRRAVRAADAAGRAEAAAWISALTGAPAGEDFGEWSRDGVVLCELAA